MDLLFLRALPLRIWYNWYVYHQVTPMTSTSANNCETRRATSISKGDRSYYGESDKHILHTP